MENNQEVIKMTKIETGFKCDGCGILEDKAELTLHRYGYPEIDALHFCSLKCLIEWVEENE